MSVALLLLALIPVADVSVVVLARHGPRAARVEGDGCTAGVEGRSRAVTMVRVDGEGVVACDSRGTCATGAVVEVRCRAPLTLHVDGLEPRTYGRALTVRARGGALRLVTSVAREDYVAAVVARELVGDEAAALAALAVVARTYAAHAALHPRHDDAALCDLTHCQVFAGATTSARAVAAARVTGGQILIDVNGAPAPVFHHAACGGHTVAATTRWRDPALASIVGVDDHDASGAPYCHRSAHARWVVEIERGTLASILAADVGRRLDPASLVVRPRDDDGARYEVGDVAGVSDVSGTTLHRTLGRALGWAQVKSPRFSTTDAGGRIKVSGVGFGHGVGLCQEGARGRARAGATSDEILAAYFPRLATRSTPP